MDETEPADQEEARVYGPGRDDALAVAYLTPPLMLCGICGVGFIPAPRSRAAARWCSTRCRTRALRQRRAQ